MAVPVGQFSFSLGEIAPSLYGRADLARFHTGATTARNMFVRYTGGLSSRGGTAFVGYSKQTGRSYPHRLIPFQFSLDQGLPLEFGNNYMRVISDGAYVTETPFPITGITQANPAVVTIAAVGALTATAIIGAVSASYAPGDTVSLAGGTFATRAVLNVTATTLKSLALNSAGTSGYVPNDTILLLGGTQTTGAELVVSTTKAVSATVTAGGSGGTPGTQTVTGTTGTGTKFQASVTVSGGGAITAVLSISVAGSYTVNPTDIVNEPVTGASLSGATLSVKMGVATFAIFNGGEFTANPSGATFTQAVTSGDGMGATFQTALMAPGTLTVNTAGSYSVLPSNPVSQNTTSGSGSGATFTLTWSSMTIANGDWVNLASIGGMTQLNGNMYVAAGVSGSTFQLKDVFGNNVNSTGYGAYTSGGTAARVYTLPTPYGEADLPYLKFTQSADVMSLTCINQMTNTEYPPQDLRRLADNNWTLTTFNDSAAVGPPTGLVGATSSVGTTVYQYVVTAIDPDSGAESVASDIVEIASAVNIAATAGTISLSWSAVPTVIQYNIYKAAPGQSAPPYGAQFGYAGTVTGTQFHDSNVTADYAQTPPRHQDPFAQGVVKSITVTAGGSGYGVGVSLTYNTSTGSGVTGTSIVNAGAIQSIVVFSGGKNFLPGDTATVTGGGGAGATVTLNIGPISGTYPGTVCYFQQRRLYAATLNQPDTYFMSQPGQFTNFDSRIPTIDSDAITGTPWAVQVDGIQFMVPMPGGLVVFTGSSIYQVTGNGGSSLTPTPITPSSQQAQPQEAVGCSATLPPLKIGYEILFAQSKGYTIRDISYQYFQNIYTGDDLTLNSSHLFYGYTIREWAWAQEPYKVAWAVRSDGILMSLTFVKAQQVAGWTRHDTQGSFVTVCSVSEPPVDAVYVGVQRTINGQTSYMTERLDNRLWQTLEESFCVDSGLALSQPEPAATLTVSSATGLGAVSGYTGLVGGTGYSAATTCAIVDDNGKGAGTGAAVTPTIAAGVITALTISPAGTGYTSPKLVITDPSNAGSGASATLTLTNTATFTASAAVFSSGNIGDVIRTGGGKAVITAFTSSTVVTANIVSPITAVYPNTSVVIPQLSGAWTMTTPVTTISGLIHLAGASVTGLADGAVIPATTVSATGTITLGTAASAVVVGLGFQAQAQSMFADTGEPTIQGQRKKIAAVTARVELSKGLKTGTNQPDGPTFSPAQIAPVWRNLAAVPDKGTPPFGSTVSPLYTGDVRTPTLGGFDTPGQVAFQQDNPLPMNILAVINEILPGDTPELREGGRGG